MKLDKTEKYFYITDMPDGNLTESEMDSSGIRNWENKLSEEERARIAIMEWKNDQKIDYKKPLKDYPQIGFGMKSSHAYINNLYI